MCNETRGPAHQARSGTSRDANAWRRFLAWVKAFEETTETSYDEIQDRRLLALECEVAELKAKLDASGFADNNPAGRASATPDA